MIRLQSWKDPRRLEQSLRMRDSPAPRREVLAQQPSYCFGVSPIMRAVVTLFVLVFRAFQNNAHQFFSSFVAYFHVIIPFRNISLGVEFDTVPNEQSCNC